MTNDHPAILIAPIDVQSKVEAGAKLLDIRNEADFNQSKIKNSHHLDKDNMSSYFNNIDKTLPIIVCCYKGISARQVASQLVSTGYDEVYVVIGGFNNYVMQCPTECI